MNKYSISAALILACETALLPGMLPAAPATMQDLAAPGKPGGKAPAAAPAPDINATPDINVVPDDKADAEPAKDSGSPKNPANALNSPSFGDYLSGRFAESQGDTEHGTKFLNESLKRDPKNKDMLASLYRMSILSGKIEDAIPLAQKLAGIKVVEDGSEFSPEMLLAVEEGKKGNYVQALKHLDSIPKVGFNNLLVPLLQQWLKLGAGQIKAPVEAKSIMPDVRMILPHVYLNVALIDDIAGYNDVAVKQYEASVKDSRIEPFRAVEAFANYYSRHAQEDKRKKLVDDYLSAHGDSFLADEILVEPAGANPVPLVKNATDGMAEVFYTMANIFHGVRAPGDEIALLHLALYLRADFPAAEFLLASTYELGQDYPSAIATYNAIDKQSPYYVRGRIRAVYDESEMGEKAAAIAKLDTIASENPQDIDAYLAKGDILRAENRFKDAVEAYTNAANRIKSPQKHHWIVYFSRGASYESMGQSDKSEADMKKALTLNPGEPDVLNYLGYTWLTQRRNIPEAKKMIEEAYDARPENPQIIDSMGYALYVSGDFTSAQEYFEQALERTPNDATVNDHLGDTYWQQGRKTEARYQWQRALADEPDAETKQNLHKKLDKGLALIHPIASANDKKLPAPASSPAEE